jgi:hypothetical protein
MEFPVLATRAPGIYAFVLLRENFQCLRCCQLPSRIIAFFNRFFPRLNSSSGDQTRLSSNGKILYLSPWSTYPFHSHHPTVSSPMPSGPKRTFTSLPCSLHLSAASNYCPLESLEVHMYLRPVDRISYSSSNAR